MVVVEEVVVEVVVVVPEVVVSWETMAAAGVALT